MLIIPKTQVIIITKQKLSRTWKLEMVAAIQEYKVETSVYNNPRKLQEQSSSNEVRSNAY